MTALTKALIEEIVAAPESVQREVSDFLAFLKTREGGAVHEAGEERAAWLKLSATNLSRVYGSDEPEYTDAHLRERYPHYEGR